MTFFSSSKHQFPVVSQGQDIETVPFLAACSEIVPFFGKFIERISDRIN